MKILELILVVSVVLLMLNMSIGFTGFGLKPIDPYVLKAKVFSTIEKLRRTEEDYVLRIYSDHIWIKVGNRRFTVEHGVDIEMISSGYIEYRNGRITKSGTVYGSGWSLSFLPVTGSMRVGE